MKRVVVSSVGSSLPPDAFFVFVPGAIEEAALAVPQVQDTSQVSPRASLDLPGVPRSEISNGRAAVLRSSMYLQGVLRMTALTMACAHCAAGTAALNACTTQKCDDLKF